jgi:UDP-GlcNAc:undecaprenyl-phosphate GlcNAc-1-phosphate transferase
VTTGSICFLLALLMSWALTPAVRDAAARRGWAGRPPSARDVHTRPVPRIGGLAIVVAALAPLAALFVFEWWFGPILPVDRTRALAIVAGGLAVAALGLYDDLRGADAVRKLVVQSAVAAAMWMCGIRIDVVSWFGGIDLGALSLPVTVLWIVGVVNALNLIDGLDGLASGVALLALVPSLVISIWDQNAFMTQLLASLAGAIVGFLRYNFNPASVFMGDTGSMFLGFVLATGSIVACSKSSAALSLTTPVLALGLPLLDTALAIVRRSLAGRPFWSADRDHLHHRLLRAGLSHRQSVLVLYGASLVLAMAALAAAFANSVQTAVLLVALAVAAGLGIRRLGYGRLRATPLPPLGAASGANGARPNGNGAAVVAAAPDRRAAPVAAAAEPAERASLMDQ